MGVKRGGVGRAGMGIVNCGNSQGKGLFSEEGEDSLGEEGRVALARAPPLAYVQQ